MSERGVCKGRSHHIFSPPISSQRTYKIVLFMKMQSAKLNLYSHRFVDYFSEGGSSLAVITLNISCWVSSVIHPNDTSHCRDRDTASSWTFVMLIFLFNISHLDDLGISVQPLSLGILHEHEIETWSFDNHLMCSAVGKCLTQQMGCVGLI